MNSVRRSRSLPMRLMVPLPRLELPEECSLRRQPSEGGKCFRREFGNVGKFRQQDGGRDVAKAGDALEESKVSAQDRIVVDQAPYFDEHHVDLPVEPRNVSSNRRCHGG
jgi:hypothetical protein